MNNDKIRKEIIADIDSGKYLKDNPKSTRKMLNGATIFILICLTIPVYSGILALFGVSIISLFIATVVFALISIPIIKSSAKQKIYGELSNSDRQLIQNGDMLVATIDSVDYDEEEMVYVIHCSAEYKGQMRQFKTPKLETKPMVSEKKKTYVFVDPQNLNNYFVNYYGVMPVIENEEIGISGKFKKGKIEDRSEVKNKPVDNDIDIEVLRKGDYVEAEAYEIYSHTSDDEVLYSLRLRYVEPNSKIVHEFEVENNEEALEQLVGVKVKVYVNVDDTSDYFVDYQDALAGLGYEFSDTSKTAKI